MINYEKIKLELSLSYWQCRKLPWWRFWQSWDEQVTVDQQIALYKAKLKTLEARERIL